MGMFTPATTTAEPGEGPRGERNGEGREGREGVRIRMGQGAGNGEGPPMVRNLPPEAQAMIEEFRRRRAERGSQNQNRTTEANPNRQR